MGFFNLFKKATIINDGFFGPLRYWRSKSGISYFSGSVYFSPKGKKADIIVEADAEQPTGEQHQFYRELESNFPKYAEKIKPLIEEEFRNWKEDFEIRDFVSEFELSCLTIPRLNNTPFRWDISFTTIHDKNHLFTISFVNYEPEHVHIDG
jgi:hypothetical protein